MQTTRKSHRIDAIDQLRGLLMCVIVLAHATSNLDRGTALGRAAGRVLVFVFNLGTPGFTMVSGTLLGYFAASRDDLRPILRKYRERGVLLLLATHGLIAAALYYPITGAKVPFVELFLGRWYVTDTLAVIFILLAPVAMALPPARRLALGVALLGVAPFVWVGVVPEGTAPLLLKEILFGVRPGRHVLHDTYPLVQLTALFLVGSSLGDRYARALAEDTTRSFARWLGRPVVPLVCTTGLMLGLWYSLKTAAFGRHPLLQEAFYPDRSLTLLPFYVACYLALFAFWVRRSERRSTEGGTLVDRVFLTFGKTSLFTYVVQYFVVQTVPHALGLQGALSVAGVAVLAAVGFTVLYHAAFQWSAVIKRA